MSTKLDIKVFNDQVKKELEDANKKFPPISSDHEGYAVLLEEFEELTSEILEAKSHLGCAWSDIKRGKNLQMQQNLWKMRTSLRRAYKELVQTAAMIEKWMDRYQPDPNWAGKEEGHEPGI